MSAFFALLHNQANMLAFLVLWFAFFILTLSFLRKNSRHNSSSTEAHLPGELTDGSHLAGETSSSGQLLQKQQEQMLQQSQEQLQKNLAEAQAAFKTYLDTLSKRSDTSLTTNEQLIKEKTNQLFERFEQNLSGFLTQTQQQSTSAINLEMQAARQLIESYKMQQFKMVDENIVAMLERTLSLVLMKKLTLKEHVDLVYESLEKAKAEKFLL